MEFVVSNEVVAKIDHVVLNFGRPAIPQSIFSAETKHPSADGPIDRASAANPAYPRDDDAAADVCAGVSPGTAHFAIDKPAIEGVAEPRSKRGDPIEPHTSVGRRDRGGKSRSGGKDKRRVHSVLYGSPRDVRFDAQHPLRIDLVIEPYLTAAQKAAIATPTGANVSTHVESGPVIADRYHGRGPVDRSRYGVRGVGRNWRPHHHRRNTAECEEPLNAHGIDPPTRNG